MKWVWLLLGDFRVVEVVGGIEEEEQVEDGEIRV